MKKFSRIYKRWTALFLAFLMMAQPVVTSFAEVADGSTLLFAAQEDEAANTEEDKTSSEETAAEPDSTGETGGEASEENGTGATDTGSDDENGAGDGTATGDGTAAGDGAALEEDAAGEEAAASEDSSGEKAEGDLAGAGEESGIMTVRPFSNLNVYAVGSDGEETPVDSEGGDFEYTLYEDLIQIKVYTTSTSNGLYGVYIKGNEEEAEEHRCESGDDRSEEYGVRIDWSGDDTWSYTIKIDPTYYGEGFYIEFITDEIPADGKFYIHMNEEDDRNPYVYYKETEDEKIRVWNGETYDYTAGEQTHTFEIQSPLADGTVYAAEVKIRKDGRKQSREYFPSQEEGSRFVRQDDGSYLLTLSGDGFFPDMVTGGFVLSFYWSLDEWQFHHFDVNYETERRIEVSQKSGDRDSCGLELLNGIEGHHAYNREVYSISKEQGTVNFKVNEGDGYRFDHADVYAVGDNQNNFEPKTYYRSDLNEYGNLIIAPEEGEEGEEEGLPDTLYVDHYYEEIPTEEAFTLDAAEIKGTAHETFAEKELVLRLKEGFSWNTAVAGLTAGSDFSAYAALLSG